MTEDSEKGVDIGSYNTIIGYLALFTVNDNVGNYYVSFPIPEQKPKLKLYDKATEWFFELLVKEGSV